MNKKVKPNFHVSEVCEHCVASGENVTPPILMEFIFQGKIVDCLLKFVPCGDCLELIALAGVTSGFCYMCERKQTNQNLVRGQKRSRHETAVYGENVKLEKFDARTLKMLTNTQKTFRSQKPRT